MCFLCVFQDFQTFGQAFKQGFLFPNSVIASLCRVTEALRFVLSRTEGQITVWINGRSAINECKGGKMDLRKVECEQRGDFSHLV